MKVSNRKVHCMTCGNQYRVAKGKTSGCPTCTGAMKEKRQYTRRTPNNT